MMNESFPEWMEFRPSRGRQMSIRINASGLVKIMVPTGVSKEEACEFLNQKMEWVLHTRQKMMQKGATHRDFFDRLQLISRADFDRAAARLDAIILPLLGKYTGLMGLPGIPRREYSGMKSRWGWCKKQEYRVRFSLYLLLLPQECIEMVVAHELCHMFVSNHSKQFYALLERYYPAWDSANRLMCQVVTGP